MYLQQLSASQKCEEHEKKEGKWKLQLHSFSISCVLGYMVCDIFLDNTLETSKWSCFYTFILFCAKMYTTILTQNSGLIFFIPNILISGVSTCYLIGCLVTIIVLSETWSYGLQQLLFLVGICAETLLKIWERREEKQAEKEH